MEQRNKSGGSTVPVIKTKESQEPIYLNRSDLREMLFEHAVNTDDPTERSMVVVLPRSYVAARIADFGDYGTHTLKGFYQDFLLPLEMKKLVRTRDERNERLPNRPQRGEFSWLSIIPELPLATTPESVKVHMDGTELDDPTVQLPPMQILGQAAIEASLETLKSELPPVHSDNHRDYLAKYSTYWALRYLTDRMNEAV